MQFHRSRIWRRRASAANGRKDRSSSKTAAYQQREGPACCSHPTLFAPSRGRGSRVSVSEFAVEPLGLVVSGLIKTVQPTGRTGPTPLACWRLTTTSRMLPIALLLFPALAAGAISAPRSLSMASCTRVSWRLMLLTGLVPLSVKIRSLSPDFSFRRSDMSPSAAPPTGRAKRCSCCGYIRQTRENDHATLIVGFATSLTVPNNAQRLLKRRQGRTWPFSPRRISDRKPLTDLLQCHSKRLEPTHCVGRELCATNPSSVTCAPTRCFRAGARPSITRSCRRRSTLALRRSRRGDALFCGQ